MPSRFDTERAPDGLEARLRAKAPAPRAELAEGLAARVRARGASFSPARAAAAVGATGSLAVALALAGGIDYAAAAVRDAAEVVQRAASGRAEPVVLRSLSSGGDQYRPGYGWGDPNHNHTGPPGLQRRDEAHLLRPAPTPDGRAVSVGTRIAFSEQATLYLSVVGPDGKRLLLTQSSRRGGSRIGNSISGPQTKTIRYTLLVPRAVDLRLRVPRNLLVPGRVYRIRVVALDVDGNRSVLFVPFRAAL